MFLGVSVPLPRLTPRLQRLVATGEHLGGADKTELKYAHFSVVMNKARRLAFFAAVNVDANAQFTSTRASGNDWFFDSRLPEELQAGDRYYSDNPLDRGHLVRREDAAWGTTLEEAQLANRDTFHFTNCSPQHEVFNQSGLATRKHLKLWGNLENYLTQFARSDKKRLSIFNGPLFRSTDRLHRSLRIPREFWKLVILDKGNGLPTAFAFILSQGDLIASLAEMGLDPIEFKMYQVGIPRLERETKLDFGSLRNADAFSREVAKSGALEPSADASLIQSLDDLIV